MMHLRYPHKREYYTWDELSCLSRALGFQPDTIVKCIPDEIVSTEPGLSEKTIQKLIDLKYFNDALDVSINMHSADYNINSILKSLTLLNHRLLSFAELHDVRVAFQVYEAGDMRGMRIDQHTLLRTLKLCGRTIASLKLMHRVKHMLHAFDEPGRIQLYEFLDLIVLCEQTDDIDVPESKRGPLDKTWRKLFELDDFEHVCATNDEKLMNHLNQQFRNTELNYGHEQLGSKRIPREAAVDTSVRKTQVRFHGQRYKELHKFLDYSGTTVQQAKAGGLRARPITAPDIEEFRYPAMSPIPQLQRPQTVPEDELYCRTPLMDDPRIKILQAIHDRKMLQSAPGGLYTPTSNLLRRASPTRQPRPGIGDSASQQGDHLHRLEEEPRPQTSAVVSARDVIDRQNILDSLQYEIETLEERRQQKLKDQIRHHLPRYSLSNLNQKKNAPSGKTKKRKKRRERQPSPEVIERLVHPKPKAFQAVHDKNCDSATYSQVSGSCGSRRKRKSGKKLSTGLLKPLLVFDNDEDDVIKDDKDEKGQLIETASTISSRTIESSVNKSTDLGLPGGQSSPLGHLRRGGHVPQQLRTYDSKKYQGSRVGAAAVLYNHFNSRGGAVSSDGNAGHQHDQGERGHRTEKGQSSDDVGTVQNDVSLAGALHKTMYVFSEPQSPS